MLGKLSLTLLVAMTAFAGCLDSGNDVDANTLVADDVLMPIVEELPFSAEVLYDLPEVGGGLYFDFVVVEGTTLLNLNSTWTCEPMCELSFHLVDPNGEKLGEGTGMDNVLVDIVAPEAGNWTLHVVPTNVAFMVDGVAVLTSGFDVIVEDMVDDEIEA